MYMQQYPPPAYMPQYDPMRAFFYGCIFGFFIALLLIFGVFDMKIQLKDTLNNVTTPTEKKIPSANNAELLPSQLKQQSQIERQPVPVVYSARTTPLPADYEFDAVATDALNMRELPDIESGKIRQLEKGEWIQVLDKTPYKQVLQPHDNDYPTEAPWYQIRAKKDNAVGWVFGSAIRLRKRE